MLTAVAPVNIMLTYVLGQLSVLELYASFHTDGVPVYGPRSLNLGLIGAPLSMTISYISVAVLTIFFVILSKAPTQAETGTGPQPSFVRDMKYLFLEGLAGMGTTHPVPLISSCSQQFDRSQCV